jgi:hypothetical protein
MALLCFCTYACRSASNTTKQYSSEEQSWQSETTQADSVKQEIQASQTQSDTATVDISRIDSVRVDCDSTGQAIGYVWYRTLRYRASSLSELGMEINFTGNSSSQATASASTADNVKSEKKEVAHDISSKLLLNYIGSGFLALVVIYLIYIAIVDCILPWIQKRRQQ